MLKKLNEFYADQGILPEDFRCPSRQVCSADSPNFTQAKASHVGPRYEAREIPRLLFLSLDSGSAEKDPQERTAEAVRVWNLACDVHSLEKNRHWYRTHEMALELLRQFKPDLRVEDTRLYFAHVNSAKCCQNKPGRAQADRRLFDNCRRFIPGELRLLSPDIVVTQGDWAKTAIQESFDVRRHDVRRLRARGYANKALYETGCLEVASDDVLWLHTYHPGNYGQFGPQRKRCWPLYAEAVGRFWRSREE